MVKIRSIVIVGLVSYLAVLVATFPVHYLLKLFPQIATGPVAVTAAQGTIWNGQAQLSARIQSVPLSAQADWSFLPLKLLVGKLGLDLDVTASGLEVGVEAALSPSRIQVTNLDGVVEASFINQFIRPQGAEITGDLTLNDLSLEFNHRERMAEDANGRIDWPGGNVVYRGPGGGQNFESPALLGTLKMKDSLLSFDVSDMAEINQYAGAELNQDGWAKVFVKKRIMELAGRTVERRSADKSMFEIKQKLL